ATGRLHEDHRLRWHGQVRFRGMIGIVEADTDELADIADARTETLARGHFRQFRGIERPQAGKALLGHRRRVDVVDDAGEIAGLAITVEKSGLFLALLAPPKKLHGVVPFLLLIWFNRSRGRR